MSHVYSMRWNIGACTAFSGRICDTLWTAINYGMYTTQFYMGSSEQYNRAKISEKDLEECQKILKRFDLDIFTHFPNNTNFAGSIKKLAWEGDKEQDRKTSIMLKSLEYELHITSQLSQENKRSGVVIHPGSFPDKQKGLKAVAKSINRVVFSEDSRLLLENTAGAGTTLGGTLQELRTILDNIDEEKREHVGVCIDTCHLYAYGDYDFSEEKEIDRFFSDFEDIIGMDKFWLVHLNDSEKCKKSRVDRHACLGMGFIWGKSFDPLVYFLDKCKEYKIPAVLETHGLDMLTLAAL